MPAWYIARHMLAGLAGLFSLIVCARAQEPAGPCTLTTVTQLPLSEYAGWFTTQASINGHPVTMLIDTGAARSSISPEIAARLHLPQSRSEKIIVHGIGGEMKAARPVVARAFQLGDGHLENYELTVINYTGGKKGSPGAPDGLLGLDLLSGFELEFDFPNRSLTLYLPSHCTGKFVPWTGRYDVVEGQRQLDGQLFIPVRLNKVEINAMIDTGAGSSALGVDTADDVGVPEQALKADRKTSAMGASGVPQPAYRHRFDSLSIADITYPQVPLLVQDEHFGVIQMILGMDFFRSRRLWVSFKTEQIFLQSAPPDAQPKPARP